MRHPCARLIDPGEVVAGHVLTQVAPGRGRVFRRYPVHLADLHAPAKREHLRRARLGIDRDRNVGMRAQHPQPTRRMADVRRRDERRHRQHLARPVKPRRQNPRRAVERNVGEARRNPRRQQSLRNFALQQTQVSLLQRRRIGAVLPIAVVGHDPPCLCNVELASGGS